MSEDETDPDNQIADAYFEAQARDSLDSHGNIDLSFGGLTEEGRVIFTIESPSVDAEAFAFSLEKLMKYAAMDEASWPSDFVGTLTLNSEIQALGDISSEYGRQKVTIRSPDLPKNLNPWTLAVAPDAKKDTEKVVNDNIKLAAEYGKSEHPYVTAKMESATVFDDELHRATYEVTTLKTGKTLSFTFDVSHPQSDANTEPFEELVEAAGGSPEYIPGTRVGVRPSWARPSTAHLANSDDRGLWALGTQDAIERSKMTVVGRVLNAFF